MWRFKTEIIKNRSSLHELRFLFGQSDDGQLSGYRVSNLQVLKEIGYVRNFYGLKPEMIISYDRHALHGQNDTSLRMTFDFNLRCRRHELGLAKGFHGEFFIDPDLVVLEAKVDYNVPLWLARIL